MGLNLWVKINSSSLSDLLHPEREREISYDIVYKWNIKRNYTIELTYKIETDSQT